MYYDEIIVEVWQNRDAYMTEHHSSLKEMVADLQVRQNRPNCNLVDRRVSTCKNIQLSKLSNHLQEITHATTPDLTSGLVAYYPFNGNANDENGNGNE